jgi:hypothetical protein
MIELGISKFRSRGGLIWLFILFSLFSADGTIANPYMIGIAGKERTSSVFEFVLI